MTSTVEALTSGGQRARIHDAQAVIKLPSSAKSLISDIAKKENTSDAAIYRAAIAEYLERRGYRG
jgi:predicted transcriptional regulator